MALKALANEKCLQITTWNGGESDRKSNRSKIRLRTTLWRTKGQEQHLFQNQSPHCNTQSEHQLKIFMTSYTNMVNQSKRNLFPPKMKPLGKVSNTALRK